MYAQLGSIIFQGLFGPSSFTNTKETNYAEHALIDRKPTLQKIGDKLQMITLAVHLDQGFVVPEEALKMFEDARANAEILPLVLGTGEYINDFVISKISIEHTSGFENGQILNCDVTLDLLELFDPNKEQTQQTQAVQLGTAMSINDPEEFEPVVVDMTIGAQTMAELTAAQAEANAAELLLEKVEAQKEKYLSNVEKINQKILTVMSGMNKVITMCNSQPLSDVYAVTRQLVINAGNMTMLCGSMSIECAAIISDLNAGMIIPAAAKIALLAQKVVELNNQGNAVMQSASKLTALTITQ